METPQLQILPGGNLQLTAISTVGIIGSGIAVNSFQPEQGGNLVLIVRDVNTNGKLITNSEVVELDNGINLGIVTQVPEPLSYALSC